MIEKTKEDYTAGKFITYNEYTTSTGFNLTSTKEAIEFNNYHEGLHLGFMMVIPFGWNEYQEIQWQTLPSIILWEILFVVVFTTFFTYLFNLVSMRELKPTTVAVFIYLQPLFATVFAMSLGKDELTWVKILSAILIFAGVYLVTMKKSIS